MITSWTPTTMQICVEIGPTGSAPHIGDFVYNDIMGRYINIDN